RRTTKGGIRPDVKRAEEIWNSEFGIWNSRGESTRYAQHQGHQGHEGHNGHKAGNSCAGLNLCVLGVELIVGLTQTNRGLTRMAYIFHQDQLPRLVSVVPGRERTFFVNKELTHIDDMLAGVMRYKPGVSSPYHFHEICEHFYFIMEGKGTVETPEGIEEVGP